METMELNNAQRFARALKKNGVEYLFGQSNPSSITLACMDLGIRQIGYRQENAGAYMAQAYGMMTGKVPVVTAQNGPAATLLVPGLAECLKASHPIVAVVQNVALAGEEKNAFQELDHQALFAGVAKWVKKVTLPERIEDFVDMAFTAAASGRPGPAVLLCPMDMINDPAAGAVEITRSKPLGNYPLDRPVADPGQVREAARLLAEAERPIVYAGGGVIGSGAQEELRRLQEQCALPVATSTMGKGAVDERHELSIGPVGYYMGRNGRTEHLREMVRRADVILLAGNRTNQNGTDSWTLLPPSAKYIHLDIDPMEIGRNYESLRLLGDAKSTLRALADEMQGLDLSKRERARPALAEEIARAHRQFLDGAGPLLGAEGEPIRVERFMAELESFLEDDHILVSDASFASIWIANYISATARRKFIFPRGLAGLGWGMPMAVGAKVAAPDRKVFCLTGDGGFAHVWSELETCTRHGLDIVVAVINNEILGYQRYAELARFGRHTDATDLGPVDHTLVARACGAKGIRVEKAPEIAGALREAFAHKGSAVIDLVASPASVPPVPFLLEAADLLV